MAGYVILALAYVMSQFFRAFLAVLTPVLSSELGMTKPELGLASGMFFVVFAFMQFKVGLMLDLRGPRYTAGLLFPIFAGGGAFLFALSTNSWMIIAAMSLIGIGCSPILMASYFLFAKTGDPTRFAIFTTWLVAFGTLGNVAGTTPLAFAVESFGWRTTIAALGVLAIVIGLSILAFVRRDEPVAASKGSGYSGYLTLLRMPFIWPMIPLMILAYMPPAGIRGLWAGPYLSETFGADAISIGNITFFMALAMAFGSFLYGPLDKWFGSTKWVIFAGNIIQVCALLWLAFAAPQSAFFTGLLFAAIGLFGMSYGLQVAHGRAFLPPDLLGRGVTLINFFIIIGVGVMQMAGGSILDFAQRSNPDGAFASLFLVYAILVSLALAAFIFAKETPRLKG
ncbi:MAG: MFS transporter [Rhizobiaceae bacterium]